MNWTNWVRVPLAFDEWEGMESCVNGDTIGMLLNLDEGALTVHKNGRRLGVMKDGLSGPYCWYASTLSECEITMKRGQLPRL